MSSLLSCFVLSPLRIHSWGDTLEEAFEQCAMGMFGYMTDTETVKPPDTLYVESEGAHPYSLLVYKSTFEIHVSGMPLPVH